MDDRAKAPFVVSSAGYNKPVDELKAIDEATLLKIKNGEEDVHGLIIESYMILDEVVGDEDGAGYILQPWADVQRIGDAIANSTNLLSLDIQEFGDDEMVVADQWLVDVLGGLLARNRSIEHLEINDVHYTTWVGLSYFAFYAVLFVC